MKKNTQLLGLLLTPPTVLPAVTTSRLQLVGRYLLGVDVRPSLYLGQRNGWWQSELVASHSFWSLTRHGQQALSRYFPMAYHSRDDHSQPDWHMVIFHSSPAFDVGFQYLRQQLLADQGAQLSTGVYVHPFGWSTEVVHELRQRYFQSVVVAKMSTPFIGDWDAWLSSAYQLPQVAELSQVISSYINGLLSTRLWFETMTEQQKQEFCSYFHRLHELLRIDVGLHIGRYSQVELTSELLSSFQRVVRGGSGL